MESHFGFTKYTISEFENYIKELRVARTILKIQLHHTYNPSYAHFNGNNHFDLQRAMKNYHVNHNGWNDIGQHFTIFPDGTVLTGRSVEKSPACIYGQNSNSICIENLGNFDLDGDLMYEEQKNAIVELTALLCKKFNLLVDVNRLVYHHWFDLRNGNRNNGSGYNKSCPGTNFFGGNKVEDCEQYLLPLIKSKIADDEIKTDFSSVIKYVVVKATKLNVREKSTSKSSKVKDRNPAVFGAVLRVYKDENKWYKISNSQNHWVYSRYTKEVRRAEILASVLNLRSGPSTSYSKIGSFKKGEEIFISEINGNWCKVSLEEKWVSKKYLKFL